MPLSKSAAIFPCGQLKRTNCKERTNEEAMQFYRIFFYILGCIFLALGITLSTQTGLGVSPIISMPFAIAAIWGLNFAAMTFVVYSILVGIEFILRRPDYHFADLLQIPSVWYSACFWISSAIFFTMSYSPALAESSSPHCSNYFHRHWRCNDGKYEFHPQSCDGLAHTIGEVSGKGMGLGKNIIDFSSVGISCIIGLIFAHKLAGIGIGTIIAMVGVGRVIAVFNHFFKAPLRKLAGF